MNRFWNKLNPFVRLGIIIVTISVVSTTLTYLNRSPEQVAIDRCVEGLNRTSSGLSSSDVTQACQRMCIAGRLNGC